MLSKSKYTILSATVLMCLLFSSPSMGARMEISAFQEGQVGHPATVAVSIDSMDFEISGFNLLLAVDQSSYALNSVKPGQIFEDCEWEYFTYRIIHDSAQYYNLGNYTDLLNITALANVSFGSTPQCYGLGSAYDLVEIEFLLSLPYPGHWIDCMWLPIRFYWRDCEDNVLYSRSNDTVYTASELFDYGYPDPVTYTFPGFGVPDPPCPDPPERVTVNSLTLRNGGIDSYCLLYPLKGDVNLNDLHYELSDLVLAVNYFMWGMIVFVRDPGWQLDQCDIDYNGMVTVSDIIFFVRIVLGDIPPILGPYKVSPYTTTVSLTTSEEKRLLSMNAGSDVGAVYLRFVSDNDQMPTSSDVTFFGPAFTMGNIGDTTTMLLVDLEGRPALSSGTHLLFELDDTNARLVELQVVDTYGLPFKLDYNEVALPDNFALKQNYPNPFNPSTTISFYLPVEGDWSLGVYNIAGQLVRQFNGHNSGDVEVFWDGRDSYSNEVASGIYLYRLESGESSAVRKMMLLK
jgi:hypothetical protein